MTTLGSDVPVQPTFKLRNALLEIISRGSFVFLADSLLLLPLYLCGGGVCLVLAYGAVPSIMCFLFLQSSHIGRERDREGQRAGCFTLIFAFMCVSFCLCSGFTPPHATMGWSAIVTLPGHAHSFSFLIAILNVLGIVCVS